MAKGVSSSMPAATHSGHTLSDLLAEVADGNQDAFAQLYDQTSARIHGLVVRVVIDHAQAEEVTQEVFLDVWRTAGRFDPARGSVLTWLFTIAHRKSVDRVRSSQAARNRDETYDRMGSVAYDHVSEEVLARSQATEVHAALNGLSDNQRTVLQLAYFEGCTQTEVAERLGIPLGTAKTRMRDGLRRLKDTMGGTQ